MTRPEVNIYRDYIRGDLPRVYSDLTDLDQQELKDGGIADPIQAERALDAMGARMITWDTDRGPAGVFGVTPSDTPGAGMIWAIPTNFAHKRWRFAVRTTEQLIEELGTKYDVLFNFKDARNIKQINWLKRVGFTFIATVQMPNGQTYHEFVRIMK